MVVLPKLSIDTDLHKNRCFGCGQHNPIGLKMTFSRDGDTLRSEITPDSDYQGWPGLVHGGILTLILDEAMNNMAYSMGIPCVTASLEVRLKQPIEVGIPLIVTASVTRKSRKLIETRAKICSQDGTIIAEGKSKQFIIEEESGDSIQNKGPGNNA